MKQHRLISTEHKLTRVMHWSPHWSTWRMKRGAWWWQRRVKRHGSGGRERLLRGGMVNWLQMNRRLFGHMQWSLALKVQPRNNSLQSHTDVCSNLPALQRFFFSCRAWPAQPVPGWARHGLLPDPTPANLRLPAWQSLHFGWFLMSNASGRSASPKMSIAFSNLPENNPDTLKRMRAGINLAGNANSFSTPPVSFQCINRLVGGAKSRDVTDREDNVFKPRN